MSQIEIPFSIGGICQEEGGVSMNRGSLFVHAANVNHLL